MLTEDGVLAEWGARGTSVQGVLLSSDFPWEELIQDSYSFDLQKIHDFFNVALF